MAHCFDKVEQLGPKKYDIVISLTEIPLCPELKLVLGNFTILLIIKLDQMQLYLLLLVYFLSPLFSSLGYIEFVEGLPA